MKCNVSKYTEIASNIYWTHSMHQYPSWFFCFYFFVSIFLYILYTFYCFYISPMLLAIKFLRINYSGISFGALLFFSIFILVWCNNWSIFFLIFVLYIYCIFWFHCFIYNMINIDSNGCLRKQGYSYAACIFFLFSFIRDCNICIII